MIMNNKNVGTLAPLLTKALTIAAHHHQGQFDKAGVPYILHPLHVAEGMNSLAGKIVALLHDVVEDTEITLGDLLDQGFTDKIVCAIDALTRRDNETYRDFIDRCSLNELATEVKMLDLQHNMDLMRLKCLDEGSIRRFTMYRKAAYRLTEGEWI